MKNIKFISKCKKLDCWGCNSTEKVDNKKCKLCNGTGKWTEKFWHLVYTDKAGQKLAFGVDSLK